MSEIEPAAAAASPDGVYDAFLAEGRLGYQRCASCSSAVFPPRRFCPVCGTGPLGWHTSAGRAVVHAASTIAPRGGEPYCVALVDLDEGFRMMTNVVGVPPAEVEIGQTVRLSVTHTEAGPLPLFEVAR